MRVWSFVQQKGGVGKTTLCLNLAVVAEAHGENVLIVDLDPQQSARFWNNQRGSNKPTVIDALSEKLPQIIAAAPTLGATLCMIDAPSRLDPIALAAIRASDLIVCPTLPDLLNLRPLQETVDLIDDAGKLGDTVGVINDVDESGAERRISQATEVLRNFKMRVAPTVVSHLPQFSQAYDKGKGVTEFGRGRAAEQIEALWRDLNKSPGPRRPASKRTRKGGK